MKYIMATKVCKLTGNWFQLYKKNTKNNSICDRINWHKLKEYQKNIVKNLKIIKIFRSIANWVWRAVRMCCVYWVFELHCCSNVLWLFRSETGRPIATKRKRYASNGSRHCLFTLHSHNYEHNHFLFVQFQLEINVDTNRIQFSQRLDFLKKYF